MRQFKRKKKEFTWQEIAYGLMIAAILAYVIIDAAINGRGGNPTDNW